MKNGTARVVCTCEHAAQDKLHGRNVRVANATARQDHAFVEVRCTVCKKVQRVSPGAVR